MMKDKRVVKTCGGIKNAYMLLCHEMPIEKITVSKLTDKAQINRSTFYLHYNDINAVKADIENEINLQISQYIDSFDIHSVDASTYSLFEKLTDLLDSRPIVKDYLFNISSTLYLMMRIKDMFTEKILSLIKKTHPDIDCNHFVPQLVFIISGMVDTYVKWMQTDRTTSFDEPIRLLSQLIQQSLKYISTDN